MLRCRARSGAPSAASPACGTSTTATTARPDSTPCTAASGRRSSTCSQTRYGARGGGAVCDKLYAVSKALSGADLFYQVELPEIFFFDHPVGSVVGRASYSDRFAFGQGCTVGNNHGAYPVFGESVFMMSDSKVVGGCRIGDFVIIGANSYIKDREIPSGSLVFGQEPNVTVKEGRLGYVMDYAREVFRYE